MEQKLKRDRNMGANLRKMREEHGLSQEKLCAELQRRHCDIGRSAYQKYEDGRLNIRISVLIELKNCITALMTISLKGWIYSQVTQNNSDGPKTRAVGIFILRGRSFLRQSVSCSQTGLPNTLNQWSSAHCHREDSNSLPAQ